MTETPCPDDGREPWELFAPPLCPPAESGLPRSAAESIADEFWSDDPYLAAALMWEAYAASIPPEPVVSAVSTGVQSVSYSSPGGAFGMAMARAQWFRSMAGTAFSVPVTLAPVPRPVADATAWWEVYPA